MANRSVAQNLFGVVPSLTPSSAVDLSAKQGYFAKLSSGLPIVCTVQGERPHFVITSATNGGSASFAATPGQIVNLVAGGTIANGAEISTSSTGTALSASSSEVVFAISVAGAQVTTGATFSAFLVAPYTKS